MRRKWMWIAPAALAGLVVFTFLGGEAVKLLWNYVTPELFGWREITFWQALAMLALCRILFGRTGFHESTRSRWRRRMAERRAQMTPEERERLRRRCGFVVPAAENESTGQ